MSTAITVSDFGEDAQRFLFACAYWVAASDEALVPSEQEWLEQQFGVDVSQNLTTEFLKMSDEQYFELFDTKGGLLPFEEYDRICAGLNEWLRDLMVSDGEAVESEMESARNILKRFGIEQA